MWLKLVASREARRTTRPAEARRTMNTDEARRTTKLVHDIPPEVVAEGNTLICYDASKMGPNTAWSKVEAFLYKHNLMWEETPEAEAVSTHSDNRAGLMCSGEDVEEKGRSIIEVGVKVPQGALAMQLCPLQDPMREVHVANNKLMIERAQGKLAEWTGKERLLTLATSHCSQWSKAVHAKCKTDVPLLQDAGGRLSRAKLEEMDPNMKAFLGGWTFKVISWKCELAWPGLAHLSQLAQNTDNKVGKAMGELETAISIMKYNAGGLTWDQAAVAAGATSADDKSIPGILAIAKFFGYDAGAPLVKRLEKFRSSLQLKVKMGGPYLQDVANMKFKGQCLKSFPFVRLGCMAVNLLTHKVEHGVGTCFTKADLTWLVNPTNYVAVDAFESKAMQLDGWLDSMMAEGTLGENDRCDIFFKFLIRNCLHLRQKEKLGYEKRVFDNSAEIRSAAASDIFKVAGSVGQCTWQPMGRVAGGEQPSTEAVPRHVALVAADLNSEAKALAAKGFAVGKQVLENGSTPMAGMYTIKAISDEKEKEKGKGPSATDEEKGQAATDEEKGQAKRSRVVLEKETFGGLQRPLSVELTASEVANKFKVIPDGAKFPTAMCTSAATRHVRSRSQFVHDWARCRAWKTISAAAIDRCIDDGACFIYMSNPRKLFTKRAFTPNELQIVPSTTYDGIRLDEKMKYVNSVCACCVYLDDDAEAVDVHFVLGAPPTSFVNEPMQWDERVTFEPFWWMASTSDEKLATVTKKMVWKDGVVFPTFVNEKAISEHAEIIYYVPKKGVPKVSSKSLLWGDASWPT